jgi:hypothetical protein
MTLTAVEKSLLRTLVWFDLLHYPLTETECWYYLYQAPADLVEVNLIQIESALKSLLKAGRVESLDGFWQLAGSHLSRTARFERARWAIAKRQRAVKGAKLMSYLPWVRFVGLVNTVALEVPSQASDIDLFIILQPGRLWLGRLVVVLAAHLRGWRQYGRQVRDRLCLSFFVTADQLKLQSLAYSDDPYLKFWIASVVPLLDVGIYRQWQRENEWITESLPNIKSVWQRSNDLTPNLALVEQTAPSNYSQRLVEKLFSGSFGDWCERWAENLQRPRLERYLGTKLNDGSGAVVITKQVMKLHLNDRRLKFASDWRQKLAELQLS